MTFHVLVGFVFLMLVTKNFLLFNSDLDQRQAFETASASTKIKYCHNEYSKKKSTHSLMTINIQKKETLIVFECMLTITTER